MVRYGVSWCATIRTSPGIATPTVPGRGIARREGAAGDLRLVRASHTGYGSVWRVKPRTAATGPAAPGGGSTSRDGAPCATRPRVGPHAGPRQNAAADGIAIDTGCGVRDIITLGEDGVRATTSEGREIVRDFVVGADGLWSRVRQALFEDGGPRPTGLFAARATLPRAAVPASLDMASVGVWLLPDAHVVHYPVRGGADVNIVVVLRGAIEGAESWALPLTPAELMAACRGVARPLHDLLAAVGMWLRWPLLERVPLSTYARGPAVLVGDAAHPTFPFFAQGAAMAIEDAEALAAALSRVGQPIADRLRAYDALRRPHTQRLVQAASENGRIYHLDGAMRLARNAALTVIPGTVLMSRYDWIYRDKRPVLNN